MFQSRHPAAEAHAAARAVSGAAVYVSDYPGNHDFDLLKKLVRATSRSLSPHVLQQGCQCMCCKVVLLP